MSNIIGIVNYGIAGNIHSVNKAIEKAGGDTLVINSPSDFDLVNKIVIPGVGSFKDAMQELENNGFIGPLKEFDKPILGICLGMQLLFDQSHEFCLTPGLGIFKGEVKNFKMINKTCMIPHLGWNQIKINPSISTNKLSLNPFKNMTKNQNLFYFVHSFIVLPNNSKDIFTETNYSNVKFCSSILNKNIFASQFHLEKSGNFGLEVLKNFFNNFK